MQIATLKVFGTECSLYKSHYTNNNANALMLVETETEEPFMTASVNLPEIQLKPDEVIIKNYSENEGILDILINENIVLPLMLVGPGMMLCKLLK